MEGWVSIHRKIKDHWIWKSERRLKWWIDILISVNHDDNKVLIKGSLIECKRGQSIRSLESWGKDWNVTKGAVRDFFRLLQNDFMITSESLQFTTRITVCNYDDYQDYTTRRGNAKKTEPKRRGNDEGMQTIMTNNENKENNVNNNILSEKSDNSRDCFEVFRKAFPGVKRGFEVEYKNFIKKNKPEIVELLLPALNDEITYHDNLKNQNAFVPEWKNLSTWINQKCWTQELPSVTPKKNSKDEFDLTYQEMCKLITPSFTMDNFEMNPSTKLWRRKQPLKTN